MTTEELIFLFKEFQVVHTISTDLARCFFKQITKAKILDAGYLDYREGKTDLWPFNVYDDKNWCWHEHHELVFSLNQDKTFLICEITVFRRNFSRYGHQRDLLMRAKLEFPLDFIQEFDYLLVKSLYRRLEEDYENHLLQTKKDWITAQAKEYFKKIDSDVAV